MLAAAKRNLPTAHFQQGDAAALPFGDGAFNTVVSQFALMLFDDREQALVEMWRVLTPNGHLTVAVFDGLGNNLAYAKIADVYEKHVGPDIANALRYPFSMGDVSELKSLFAEAGTTAITLKTVSAKASFSSATHLARSDIDGWFPFAGFAVSPADTNAVIADLTTAFAAETAVDGSISFDAYAHIVTAVKT
jgi:ubiquinone/menaquinone biosynthesis C-methylase UbiE